MDGNVLRGIRQEEGARAPVLLPSFCTGFGQADTHSPEINGRDGKPRQNGHPSAGTDYQTIKLTDVRPSGSFLQFTPKLMLVHTAFSANRGHFGCFRWTWTAATYHWRM